MKKCFISLFLLVFALGAFAQPIQYKILTACTDADTCSSAVSYPKFDNKTVLGKFANDRLSEAMKETDEYLLKVAAETKNPVPDTLKINCTVSRCDTDIISGFFQIFFNDGKKDYMYYETFNFGMMNGEAKMLTLSDCFYNQKDELWVGAFGELSKNPNATYIAEGKITMDTEPVDFRESFVITKNYISFILDPGVIAPEDKGEFIYKLKFTYYTQH